MRVAFFVLLVINLALGAWVLASRPAAPAQPSPRPEGVAPLQLLSERDSGGTPRKQRQAAQPAPSGEGAACYTVGPFETDADARRLAGKLENVRSTNVRRTQAQSEIGRWVYLPAFSSREEAMATARKLAAADLRDYYVVTSGDQENTISLGLYRDDTNAKRRVDRLRELGFNARVKVRTEAVPRYWLDASLERAADLDWQSLLAAYESASVSQTDCQG